MKANKNIKHVCIELYFIYILHNNVGNNRFISKIRYFVSTTDVIKNDKYGTFHTAMYQKRVLNT